MTEPKSPHFALHEFAVSAGFPDLVEPVPENLWHNVQDVMAVLELIRARLNRPMRILSGYRSAALNAAAQGSPTSQHRIAQAADFTCDKLTEAFREILRMIATDALPGAGQIIIYPAKNFVHVAVKSRRFPTPTPCIHWPERAYTYKIIPANVDKFNSLLS